MTTISPGSSGNLGGPSIPLQRDLEVTAWTEINKAALGIVYDSIEKVFSEISPRYQFGYLGGFGYRSTASNPLLDHPLESANLTPSFARASNQGWQTVYENLVNQLPSDLLARFTLELNKPFDQRSPSFAALDNILQLTAQFLAQTQNLAQPTDPNSLEAARTTLNLLLPFAALKGVLANSNETVLAAQNFLMSQGANFPNFDGFNYVINQLQAPLTLMARVNDSLNNTIDGQLSPQAKAAAEKAAVMLATLGSQLENITLGTDLQMMLPTIHSLEMIATALSLQNTQTAPLFMALSMASNALFTSDSPAGIMGPSYEALVSSLNTGLLAALLPPGSKGGNELFALLTTTSLTVLTGLASLAVDPGLGIYPQTDLQTSDAAKFFAFETFLQLAVNTGFVETFYHEAVAISGGNTQAQDLGSSSLAQLAHLLMILSGSMEGDISPFRLIEDQAHYLNQGITSASTIEQTGESSGTASTAIALQLAALALESRDYEGFLNAFNNTLENLGTSQTQLENDITNINQTAQMTVELASTGNPDQQFPIFANII